MESIAHANKFHLAIDLWARLCSFSADFSSPGLVIPLWRLCLSFARLQLVRHVHLSRNNPCDRHEATYFEHGVIIGVRNPRFGLSDVFLGCLPTYVLNLLLFLVTLWPLHLRLCY